MALAVDTRTGKIIEVSSEAAADAEAALVEAVDVAALSGGYIGFSFGGTEGLGETETIGFDPNSWDEVDEDFDASDDVGYDDEDEYDMLGAEGGNGGGGGTSQLLSALLPAVIPLASTAVPAVSRAVNLAIDQRLARRAAAGNKQAAARLKARRARRPSPAQRAPAPVATPRAAVPMAAPSAQAPAASPAGPNLMAMLRQPAPAAAPAAPAALGPRPPAPGGGLNLFSLLAPRQPSAVAPSSPAGGGPFALMANLARQRTTPKVAGDSMGLYDNVPRPGGSFMVGADGYQDDELDYVGGSFIGYDGNNEDAIGEDEFLADVDSEIRGIEQEDDEDDDASIEGERRRKRRRGRLQRTAQKIESKLARGRLGRMRQRRLKRRLGKITKVDRRLAQRQVKRGDSGGRAGSPPRSTPTANNTVSPKEGVMNFVPAFPGQGRLVTLAFNGTTANNNGVPYHAATLVTTTAAAAQASVTMETSGVSYADLELVGLVVQVTTRGTVDQQVGFWVTNLQGAGDLEAIYAPQVCLLKHSGFQTGTASAAAQGYGVLYIPGLRQRNYIEKTSEIALTVVLRAFGLVAATTNFVMMASAICNVVRDKTVDKISA